MVFGKIRLSTLLILLGLVIAYFVTRLFHIMFLPIFTDEAIYVRWSQIARQDAAWRFISLTDGKQPLFIWLAMNSMRIIHDPLLAARLVSVCAGFGTLLGIVLLILELGKKREEGGTVKQIFGHLTKSQALGFIAGTLFVLFPFALIEDRMAMYDSLVACTMIWSLYMEVLLIRYVRLDIALITGFVIGFAILTKTSGFFAMYLLPFSFLLFDFSVKQKRKQFLKWLFFVIIACIVSFMFYSILRLSPFFYIINEKNALFVRPVSQVFYNIVVRNFSWFDYVSGNFHALAEWFMIYVGAPALFLAAFSFFCKGYLREKLLLLAWFIIPFVALGFFGNTLYPRFIYFMTIPAVLLAAFALNYIRLHFKLKIVFPVVFLLVCAYYVRADRYILFDFAHAPIPQADLGQYINSWPAGGGIREMVSFFEDKARVSKIYVASQGTFGSLPTNSIEIYLGNNPNIDKRGIYPLPEKIPQDLLTKARIMPVYYVFNDSENAPTGWPLKLIAKYQKGIGDRHLSIYQVIPE